MIFLILQKTIVSFVLLKLFLLFKGMIAPCNILVKKNLIILKTFITMENKYNKPYYLIVLSLKID